MITDCKHEMGVCPGQPHCDCDCVNCARKIIKKIIKNPDKAAAKKKAHEK